jgi:hypothetical protein
VIWRNPSRPPGRTETKNRTGNSVICNAKTAKIAKHRVSSQRRNDIAFSEPNDFAQEIAMTFVVLRALRVAALRSLCVSAPLRWIAALR